MIVPGGGHFLGRPEGVSCRLGFFLPVRVLSRLFRRLFLEKLVATHAAGRLQFFGAHANLADRDAMAMHVRLDKDGFQLIARRLPGNLQTPGRRSREKRRAQCDAGELRFELATELASHGP